LKTKSDTIESLTEQIEESQNKRRELKRAESSLNLQLAVGQMGTDKENVAEILTACYSYIANHRRLVSKKSRKTPLPVTGAY